MKPVANWRAVLRRAWSMRLMLLAGLLSGAEVALQLLDGIIPIPPGVFAAPPSSRSALHLLPGLSSRRNFPMKSR
jgi:hypothetical protein